MNAKILPPDVLVSRSGAGETYIITDEGEKLIAASRRADGSFRRAIKVRPGFMPIEEQERFAPRIAKVVQTKVLPGLVMQEEEPKKTRTKRGGKKKPPNPPTPLMEPVFELVISTPTPAPSIVELTTDMGTLTHEELLKRHAFIKKKLQEAKTLKGKLNQGGQILPNQIEKVNKIDSLASTLEEIKRLLETSL